MSDTIYYSVLNSGIAIGTYQSFSGPNVKLAETTRLIYADSTSIDEEFSEEILSNVPVNFSLAGTFPPEWFLFTFSYDIGPAANIFMQLNDSGGVTMEFNLAMFKSPAMFALLPADNDVDSVVVEFFEHNAGDRFLVDLQYSQDGKIVERQP